MTHIVDIEMTATCEKVHMLQEDLDQSLMILCQRGEYHTNYNLLYHHHCHHRRVVVVVVI